MFGGPVPPGSDVKNPRLGGGFSFDGVRADQYRKRTPVMVVRLAPFRNP